LLNQGTVAWTATGGIEMGTGAVFTNADGGRFDITGGQGAITDVSGAGTPDPRIENLPGAIVTRNGTSVATIGVPFTNQGTIRLLTGTLQIANNFTNQAGATLEYVISGPDPGTGFGRLAVTGTFTAGGNLVVTNAPGFTPTEGQTFTITTCGACTGTFANVSSPYPVQYNPTNIRLNAVGPSVGLNPTALGFGDQVVGTTSSALPVTVADVMVSGAAEFTKTADTCTNATVAAGATCTVSVTFTPSAQGPRSAALTVQDNAAGSPDTVPLTGTGTTASAAACTITWTGGAGTGQWTTEGNWSPVRVPNTTDFACIPATVAEEVVISAGANVVRGVRAEGAGGLRQTGGTLRLTDTTSPSLIRDFRFAGGPWPWTPASAWSSRGPQCGPGVSSPEAV
jgi:hypothetical protein